MEDSLGCTPDAETGPVQVRMIASHTLLAYFAMAAFQCSKGPARGALLATPAITPAAAAHTVQGTGQQLAAIVQSDRSNSSRSSSPVLKRRRTADYADSLPPIKAVRLEHTASVAKAIRDAHKVAATATIGVKQERADTSDTLKRALPVSAIGASECAPLDSEVRAISSTASDVVSKPRS